MVPTGRHEVRDFSTDLDFASRFLLGQVRPPFGVVWSDLDKGCGVVVMAGMAQGAPVLRGYLLRSAVAPTSTRLTDTESEVRMNGSVLEVRPQGQVSLAAPAAEAPHGTLPVRAAFAFLARALPGWDVAWARPGVATTLAILTREVGGERRWLFGHVSGHTPVGMRFQVDLSLATQEVVAAMRPVQAARTA